MALPRLRLRLSRPTLFLLILLLLATSLIFISHSHDHADAARSAIAPDLTGNHGGYTPVGGSGSGWLGSLWSGSSGGGDGGLEFRDDGLVYGFESLTGKQRERHPIEILMKRGKDNWEALLDRQSRTLPRAVTEYNRRYGRNPPKGFEEWWQFCKKNGVKIVDDYDQINADIEPFLALSPADFRKRADDLMETPHKYEIHISKEGESSLTGNRASSARGKLLFSLISSLGPLLPCDLTIHISDHDLGSWLLGDDQRELLLDAARNGRYVDPETELKPLENKQRDVVKTLESACPHDSPAYLMALEAGGDSDILEQQANEALMPHPPTFIHNARPLYDFCYNPSLIWIHGAFGWHQTRDTVLRPIFQLSKNVRNAEFLTTPLEAYENSTSPSARKKYTPWEEKTINKLFWRGSSTGDSYSHHKDYDWHRSHRPRLHLMAQKEDGESDVWVKRGKEWAPESWSNKRLNEQYLDVGLTGKPHQCKQEDGTCDEMAAELKMKDRVQPEVAKNYKYVFDIDGNGWSSRLHRLMTSGSVVVKSTIYPEWHSDWMTPWVHYIPTQMDYSDIYTIMAFFAGSPDGRTRGNDELAEQIAEQGKQFADEHWRWEDMQAYMLRLLLEYARLQADDRDAFSYNKKYS